MKMKWWQIGSLGIQHVLAMYAGAIVVPLVVGGALQLSGEQLTYLVAVDLLTCGIATFLQVWKNKLFGIGLPVMLGCTFTAVGPMIAIGGQYGMTAVYGSILCAGLVVVLISPYFGKLRALFPPVVTGSVVTIIGLTLIPAAVNNMAGGQGAEDFGDPTNLALSFGVLALIVVLYRCFKGFIRSIAILLGMAAGTAVAAVMGKVDWTAVTEASWVHLPQPFYFGVPSFHGSAILTMVLVAIVSLVESTGVYFALSDICRRRLTDEDLAGGYRAEGLAIIVGGLLNAFPYTTYSQNVGLVQLSGVKTRNVIYAAALFLILLGFVPKIAAVATIIPAPVLGGAMLAMFGMVIAYGVKMLSQVDLTVQENLLIIACSIGVGLGVTAVPNLFAELPAGLRILTDSGIVAGSMTAIILNAVFHFGKVRRSATLPLQEQKIS
ncbi:MULTISPECIES: nucleobase:cation symporter-2 family protein [Geobacillus]|jgi:xanthine permease|uniref:nucleobase:cation symporter-2 family protein n=1 Tax=Geobacillus TaxID=129337 RepID=UPI0006E575B4|nr:MULTISPECIES: nucleobase:cation symporter-2 family protein [Geobacillus]KQB93601.1 Xanthine permease [Geobacillus sp. PA-3]MEC5186423.1 xanthine permease [Geobacillus thermodenitrificans]MED3717779.1 nucleobase:cation symporter-2 family protein [Geobacillus thermodenitrificans]MED3907049.1 nucleobase:cation symporter-2 family protein [Geobacillus thermodenitrificans]MED4918546.1 nucleobase:cation symporter-2 family protein [Geobacillus thermodenitrificans]